MTYLKDLKDIPTKEMFPGYTGRVLPTQTKTVAFLAVKAGRRVPEQ